MPTAYLTGINFSLVIAWRYRNPSRNRNKQSCYEIFETILIRQANFIFVSALETGRKKFKSESGFTVNIAGMKTELGKDIFH